VPVGVLSRSGRSTPDFPIYAYNIPSNVTNVIGPEVLAGLMEEFPNVVGVKDSSMDFMNFINFQQAAPRKLCALMGNDAQIYSSLLMGGSGGVSATATAFPEPVVEIYENIRSGNLEKALAAQDKVIKLRAIFRSYLPIPAYKQVLKWRGLNAGVPRTPLRQLNASDRKNCGPRLPRLASTSKIESSWEQKEKGLCSKKIPRCAVMKWWTAWTKAGRAPTCGMSVCSRKN